jgi:hypothetical protein
MTDKPDFLLLKWGTLKGWNFKNSPEAFEALKEYDSIGSWTGEDWTNNRDAAKKYVMEYGSKK